MNKCGTGTWEFVRWCFCISILPLLGIFTAIALAVSSTDWLVQGLCFRLLQYCLFPLDHIYGDLSFANMRRQYGGSVLLSFPNRPCCSLHKGGGTGRGMQLLSCTWGKVNSKSLQGFHPPLGNFVKGENFTGYKLWGLLLLNRNYYKILKRVTVCWSWERICSDPGLSHLVFYIQTDRSWTPRDE